MALAPGASVQAEGLLHEPPPPAPGEEPGPSSELEYWRLQMSRINALMEQLKHKECRLVLGIGGVLQSQVRNGCSELELRLCTLNCM
jgi:Dynein heavy chain, N-terminal region 1